MATTPANRRDLKPVAGRWLAAASLQRLLAGCTPEPSELIDERELFKREPRLGIARFNQSRTVQESLLYQTSHVRPEWRETELAVEVELAGTAAGRLPEAGVVRLGGEGRPAYFQVDARAARSDFAGVITPAIAAGAHGLILLLLTPLAVAAESGPVPLQGFEHVPPDATCDWDRWRGDIGGIELVVDGALLPRGIRQGG